MSIPRISIIYKATYSMTLLGVTLFLMWVFFSLFDIEMNPDHIQIWLLGGIFVQVVEISLMLSKAQAVELMEGKGK